MLPDRLSLNQENALTNQRSEKPMKNISPNRSREKRWTATLAVIAPLFLLALSLLASCNQSRTGQTLSGQQGTPTQSAPATPVAGLSEQAAKDTEWDPTWPPLPNPGTPAKPIEQVRAMYAFAARRPEALQYAPCYCGCESGGHKSVLDCFVTDRTRDGKPHWDRMGFT